MNIAINCCHLSDKNDGAKTRIINLYSRLIPLRKNDFFFFFIPKNLDQEKFSKNFKFNNVKFFKVDLFSSKIFKRFLLGFNYWPKVFKKYHVDFFDHSYLPLLIIQKNKTKILLTIHDLRYLNDWRNDFWRFVVFRIVLSISFLYCDKLITVSNTIKLILNKLYNRPISVIYNFINARKEHNLNNINNFVFTVGHSEKRKNFENLIKAFTLTKFNGYKGDLVICTNQGNNFETIVNLINDSPYSKNIKLFRNKSNEFVKKMYKSTKLFVLPSTYEGFGIPILEAAHYEKPIILSNIRVFKEITLNRLYYFDPNNPSDIAEKMLTILNDKKKQSKLKISARLINKKFQARHILKKFSNLFQ